MRWNEEHEPKRDMQEKNERYKEGNEGEKEKEEEQEEEEEEEKGGEQESRMARIYGVPVRESATREGKREAGEGKQRKRKTKSRWKAEK